jgi:hypothetical protein
MHLTSSRTDPREPEVWVTSILRVLFVESEQREGRLLRHRWYGCLANDLSCKARKEYVGFRGEHAFSLKYELPWEPLESQFGDDGIDFVTPAGTIDVKTSSKNDELRVYCRTGVNARIYVRAYHKWWDDSIQFRGWALGSTVRAAEIRDPHGDPYYRIAMGELERMDDLKIR